MADRLDRLEALMETVISGLLETRQLVDSNARSIQAVSNDVAEIKTAIADLRASTADVVNMIATQATEAAADRAELRRLIEGLYGNKGNGNGAE